MKRVALIITSGTAAMGVMFTGFWISSLLLNAIQHHATLRFLTWLK